MVTFHRSAEGKKQILEKGGVAALLKVASAKYSVKENPASIDPLMSLLPIPGIRTGKVPSCTNIA